MTARLLSTPCVEIPEGGYGLRVLTTTGRRTGKPHLTPVGVLHHDGRWYLVCPDRTRDWPRNLFAEPKCVVQVGTHSWWCRAVPVADEAGVEVVLAYLSVVQAPWALRSFRLGEAPDRAEIAGSLSRFGVFRLDDSCGVPQ